MNIYRIKINPSGAGEKTDLEKTFKYCRDNNLLGIGWSVTGLTHTTDWGAYEKCACNDTNNYTSSGLQQPRYIKNNVSPDDLVWTRGPNGSGKYEGKYYLARVTGTWEYRSCNDDAIDIPNMFPCELQEIESQAVPGKVIRSWGGRGRTIQRVNGVSEYSKFLWNDANQNKHYSYDAEDIKFFPLLDAWETEDLLALFLQHEGWRFVPNSANKGTTQKYEFMVTKLGGDLAWTQVKSGDTSIDLNCYKDAKHKVIVWQPRGLYANHPGPKNVTCIKSEAIVEFVRSQYHKGWLPEWLKRKAKLASDIAVG